MAVKKKKRKYSKRDIYKDVTSYLISQFKDDGSPGWRKPWQPSGFPCSMPFNVKTGAMYKGINALILGNVAQHNGDPRFATYIQANDIGVQVSKGQKAAYGVFYGSRKKKSKETDVNTDNAEPKKEEVYLVASGFAVFNGAQIDGLPPLPSPEKTWEDKDICKIFMDHCTDSLDTDYKTGGDCAVHYRGKGRIVLPAPGLFNSMSEYYATVFHEQTHRMGDLLSRNKDNYALEEMTAEIGSMMIAQELNLPFDGGVAQNSASYIKGWHDRGDSGAGIAVSNEEIKDSMEKDKYLIFKAAKDAHERVELIMSTNNFREKIQEVQGQDEAIALAVEQAADSDKSNVKKSYLPRML